MHFFINYINEDFEYLWIFLLNRKLCNKRIYKFVNIKVIVHNNCIAKRYYYLHIACFNPLEFCTGQCAETQQAMMANAQTWRIMVLVQVCVFQTNH